MTKLHTTTVRFDVDTWEALCAEADRLGIHRAAYIRLATRERIIRVTARSQMTEISTRLDRLERIVGQLAKSIR